MHFSKTYSQLLSQLPPHLQESAVQYRQLKKLINQIVLELASLGLSPNVLQELLLASDKAGDKGKAKEVDALALPQGYRVVYEVNELSKRIEPCLRFWVNMPYDDDADIRCFDQPESTSIIEVDEDAAALSRSNLLGVFNKYRRNSEQDPTRSDSSPCHEIVVPLVSDSAFFEMLSTTLHHTSDYMSAVKSEFTQTLQDLSRDISNSARPMSSTSSSFRAHSMLGGNPGAIRAYSYTHKNDLNSWREIFQLYVEAEVFESVSESSRGERTIEESEQRLQLFVNQVTSQGLDDTRHIQLKQSQIALETFLQVNLYILNIKKIQTANAEATRKILKKHAKRTALSLPPDLSGHDGIKFIVQAQSVSLPRILIQAIGETLLPIIPHLDDYACLICTAIAFKPIRLNCGHLFCVRCLVKMQKRGQGHCPMCRAPTVLVADKSNVDWALLNFMQDWFPDESRKKLKQNEKEAAEEELRELGINPDRSCCVM